MDGELYLHTTSAPGHLRANVAHESRVCFAIDEADGVFDYGRFECDSRLAFRSVVLFGRIRARSGRSSECGIGEGRKDPGYHFAHLGRP